MKQKMMYVTPAMRTVELRHARMLMTSDPVGSKATINDWSDGGTTNEEIYM